MKRIVVFTKKELEALIEAEAAKICPPNKGEFVTAQLPSDSPKEYEVSIDDVPPF